MSPQWHSMNTTLTKQKISNRLSAPYNLTLHKMSLCDEGHNIQGSTGIHKPFHIFKRDKCFLAAQLQHVSGHNELNEAAVVNTTVK